MKTEFEFIENLRRRYRLAKIGDDCAVLPKDKKTDLVVTADLLVEDVDFRLIWSKPEFIGHKALAVSLSDVAAMGAKPVWAMLSIGVPEKIWRTDFVERFYAGYFRLAKKFGVEIVGGDVSKTPEKIVVDSIAAGETRRGKAVLRAGAQAGDRIFVSGALGGAAAGLRLLETGERFETSRHKPLLRRQLAPVPQTEIGRIVGEKNLAAAMIDLSDGLSSDLAHLCRAGRVGAKIFAEKIPVHKQIKPLTKNVSEQIDLAVNGGEDFELLFAVNPKNISRLRTEIQNIALREIGEVTSKSEIIEMISGEKTEILAAQGFRHF